MSNYFTIFKLLFKYMFKRSGEKSSKWYWLAYAFIGLTFGTMIAFLCVGIASVAQFMNSMGVLPEFLTLLLMIACVAVLLFGIVPMINYLYFSKDTEFMMTLPVKPGTIFMAKLSVVYLTEIIVSTVVLVPAFVTIGVVLKLNALFYVVSLLSVVLVPAIPMVLISLIAIPLMYVVSFFKKKGALTSVVLIVLFAVIFGGYYLVISKFSNYMAVEDYDIDFAALAMKLRSGIIKIANVLFPLAAIARVATGSTRTMFGDFSAPAAIAINSVVFIASAAVLLTVAVLISSAVYRRGARSMLEGGTRKSSGTIEFTHSGSAVKALFKKEWRELFRTPAFAFQCLGGLVLCPILVLVMSSGFTMGMATEGVELSPEEIAETLRISNKIFSFVLIGFVAMMGVGMNIGSGTSITREGENFWMLKVIPVSYRDILKSKLMLYVLTSSVTVVLSTVIANVICFDLTNLICGFIFLLIYNYGFNCFSMYMDLNKPKLHWATPNEAVKQNKNATVPMLINMGVAIVLIFMPVIFIAIIPSLVLAAVVSWCVLFAIAIAVAVIFHVLLFNNADRLFGKLSV